MKNVLVLGMGKFGRRLVSALGRRKGVRIYAFDRDEKVIERWAEKVHTAGCGDLDDPEALRTFLQEVGQVDAAVISLGDSINSSLLAALQLREAQVARILIKAVDELHRRVLLSIDKGSEGTAPFEVLIPELDAAEHLAHSLSSDFVSREMPLAEGYGLLEVVCPKDFAGKTLRELDLRKRFGIMVVGYRAVSAEGEPDVRMVMPGPDEQLPEGCLLTVLGRTESLHKLEREYGGG